MNFINYKYTMKILYRNSADLSNKRFIFGFRKFAIYVNIYIIKNLLYRLRKRMKEIGNERYIMGDRETEKTWER